jgi:transglutaminase-like putative cysteine protease
MFLRISHLSRYEYSKSVGFDAHALYLRPRETTRQRLHNFALTISPTARVVATSDMQENPLDWAYFPIETRASVLEFRTEFMVETLDANPFDFLLKPTALTFPFTYDFAEKFVLAPCLSAPLDPAPLQAWLAQHLPHPPTETVSFVTELNAAVNRSLIYNRRDVPGIQSSTDTLSLGSGSCRDYAVLFIELCRLVGLAARFVSGYLYEPPFANGSPSASPAMHAWAEVYLPGAGWRGLDPTHAVLCDDAFVPVAHAALAETVNPIQGAFYGASPVTSSLHHELTVQKL